MINRPRNRITSQELIDEAVAYEESLIDKDEGCWAHYYAGAKAMIKLGHSKPEITENEIDAAWDKHSELQRISIDDIVGFQCMDKFQFKAAIKELLTKSNLGHSKPEITEDEIKKIIGIRARRFCKGFVANIIAHDSAKAILKRLNR